jgi:hypothetical protein
MKKILSALLISILLAACGNEADRSNESTGDTLPTSQGNDTSAYEGMPNRITDSTSP